MSESQSSTTVSSGVGLTDLIFVVFLFLKLAEIGQVATWSWWWVTAPLWGPFAIVLSICIIALICLLIFMGVKACCGKKRHA